MSEFLHGDLPQGFQFSFEPSIYNTSRHRKLQSRYTWESFYLIEKDEQLVQAAIHFHVEGELAISPCRAPFGGVESIEKMEDDQLTQLLEFAVAELLVLGIKKIIVKQPPFFLAGDHRLQSFQNADFEIQLTETDSFINIVGPYSAHLQERKSKKLRSLLKLSFSAQVLTLDQLPLVYDFISRMREQKGYQLSMNLQQLIDLANTFPENVILFSVSSEDKMIAASICIKVKSNWLYDFYHDHDPAFDAQSPILLLMNFIYEYCLLHSIQWLELGTSMHGEEVNENLLMFKKRLGGVPVEKITFQKKLAS